MNYTNLKRFSFEIIALLAVYGIGYTIAVARALYFESSTAISPELGGAMTMGTYAIVWIGFSKYYYDKVWATREDFEKTDKKLDPYE